MLDCVTDIRISYSYMINSGFTVDRRSYRSMNTSYESVRLKKLSSDWMKSSKIEYSIWVKRCCICAPLLCKVVQKHWSDEVGKYTIFEYLLCMKNLCQNLLEFNNACVSYSLKGGGKAVTRGVFWVNTPKFQGKIRHTKTDLLLVTKFSKVTTVYPRCTHVFGSYK